MVMMKSMKDTVMSIITNINKSICFSILSLLLSCSDFTGEGSNSIEKPATLKEIGGIVAMDVGKEGFLLDGIASAGGYSGSHFRLGFLLPPEESLKFFFYTSKELKGGVELAWMRSAEGEVTMEISLNGKTHRYRTPDFDKNEKIDVDLDVHNNHTDIHILVWKRAGSRGDREGCTYDGECLYNTEDFAFDNWLGVGRASGVYWGLEGDEGLIESLEGPLTAETNV